MEPIPLAAACLEAAWSWVRQHPLAALAAAVAVAALGFNLAAFRQAWAMLHFAPAGRRTEPPEALTPAAKLRVALAGITLPRPAHRRTPADLGLPCSARAFASGDGTRLEAWLIPGRPDRGTVLLFHGYGGARDSLLDEAAAVHRMGWTAVLVDFRGSGGSDGSVTTIGMDEAADVAAAAAAAGEWGCRRPQVAYGVSMGAAAVLRAVHEQTLAPDAVVIEAVFDRLLNTICRRFDAMGWPAFPAAHALLFWGSVQTSRWAFRHNPADYAAAVTCPALVLHGTRDARATLEQGRAVFARLAGPKTFVEFAGAGHESCLGADAAAWTAAMAAFLDGLTSRTPAGG